MDSDPTTATAIAGDGGRLARHFGRTDGLLPLWIAEPYLPLAPGVVEALTGRADVGWYGYETRGRAIASFWGWMERRHGWDGAHLQTTVSPSVGTSIAVLMEHLTAPGDGVILQPPVFTDFKPLVRRAGRTVVRNSLRLTADGYRMDLEGLAQHAADTATSMMILCNPHNPVGRVWTRDELAGVASVCAEHDVFVVADEIHADLALPPYQFTPFASVASATDVRWAAIHGPIKTFGLAGVCDTLLISADEAVVRQFRSTSARLHLPRNNVFGVAAATAAYETGETWLNGLLDHVQANLDELTRGLPPEIEVIAAEGTYLAWLDLRRLELGVPELPSWLANKARLALSPGHWFGREGAGFARMTVAVTASWIAEALRRLNEAVRAG